MDRRAPAKFSSECCKTNGEFDKNQRSQTVSSHFDKKFSAKTANLQFFPYLDFSVTGIVFTSKQLIYFIIRFDIFFSFYNALETTAF